MKKQLLFFFLIIINLCACNSNTIKTQSSQVTSKDSSNGDVSEESEELALPLSNPFFFQNFESAVYKAKFSFVTEVSLPDEVKLSISEVSRFENGILYELKIAEDSNFNNRIYYDKDGFHLGYFYVQEDKIVLLRGENILDTIKSEEDIITYGSIVCQNEERKDTLKNEEKGWHEYILVNGNQREYHSYNNLTETGFYERLVWEQGVGLVSYKSGFGAEKDDIELRIIGTQQFVNIDNSYKEYMDKLQYLIELDIKIRDAFITIDMRESRENALYHWDIELNKIYRLLIEKLSPDDVDELRTQQRQWIKNRDETANNALSLGGSMANVDYADVLFSLTKERTIELIHMYFKYGSDKNYNDKELFAPIINAYKELEQSSFKTFNKNILGSSILANHNDGDTYNFELYYPTLKYAFYDINCDNIDELIIGVDDSIASIYTLKNGKPSYICQAEHSLEIELYEDIIGNTVIELSAKLMGHVEETFFTLDLYGNLEELDTLYTNEDKIINNEYVELVRTKNINYEQVIITEEEYSTLMYKYGSRGYKTLEDFSKARGPKIEWELISAYIENN